jgi:hypothetical protein
MFLPWNSLGGLPNNNKTLTEKAKNFRPGNGYKTHFSTSVFYEAPVFAQGACRHPRSSGAVRNHRKRTIANALLEIHPLF